MKLKDLGIYALSLVFSLFLLLTVLLSTIEYVVFDTGNYQKEYARLGVETETGLDHEDLLRVTQGLLDYLHGMRDDLNIKANIDGMSKGVFTQRETDHMSDVRDLLNMGYKLRKISAFGSLIAFIGSCLIARDRSIRFLSRGILSAVCLFVIFLAAIGLFMLQDFELYWNQIHEVIFTNDLWLLDPAESILIRMVPEQFFFDMITRIMLIFCSFLVIITMPSILYVYKKGLINK